MNYLKRLLLAAICMQISFQGLIAQTTGRLGAQGNDDVWCTESWTGNNSVFAFAQIRIHVDYDVYGASRAGTRR